MFTLSSITNSNLKDLKYFIYSCPPVDMKDFGQLSSKTVTEVLMLEMKMAPAAKTYLVSGYPRSMRDVAEYSEKVSLLISTRPAPRFNWRNTYLVYTFQTYGPERLES